MRLLGIALVIALGILPLVAPFTVAKDSGLVVGVYLYPWYSSDGRHWDNTVLDKPYIGYYDSRDPATIEWQLKLIANAGIDFIIISWWGPNSFEDNAAKVIADYVGRHGLKFVIMVEPYLGNDGSLYNRSFWENVLDYIDSNYIKPYSNSYLYLHGKPLVMAFNPIGMYYNPSNDFPQYTIRITGNDIDNAKYQDWDYWPDYIDVNNVELRIRKDGMVAVIPRYSDIHFRTPGKSIDIDYSQGLYVKEWEWILNNTNNVNIVIITSWNEYHERTEIEPHYDANATVDPFYIYNLTKEYVIKAKSIGYYGMSLDFGYYILGFSVGIFMFTWIVRILKAALGLK